MGMSTYNGFDGAYRQRVQDELNSKWASGQWEPPSECGVCAQTDGAIHAHLEDYSRPETYVPLCITCHLILHMRFRQPSLWEQFTTWIRTGYRPDPQTQRGGLFAIKKCYVVGHYASWPGQKVNPPRRATYLDGLAPIRFIHPNAPAGDQLF